MATSSEIKAGLDDIAHAIRTERQAAAQVKARVTASDNSLAQLPTVHAAVIAAINAFDVQTTDPFERLCKAELAKMTAEFQSLKSKTAAGKTALAAIDFTT